MPITNQARKAMRRDAQRKVYGLRRKRVMKQMSKEVRDLAIAGNHDDASAKISSAYKAIDKAAKKGVIKKNTAARKKSKLSRLLAKTKK